ncbi:hypothetical protein ACFXJO_13030 [Streptomyces lavendulae]|uniref:hypothetical protein n=1 Tax=Streptomyces lavendulae TaxID=1914 RepID=UPI0036B711BD
MPVFRDAADVLRELVAARVHLRETVTGLRSLTATSVSGAGLLESAATVVEDTLKAVAPLDAARVAVMRERCLRS